MIFYKHIHAACFLAFCFIPGVVQATSVVSMTIEDVGSGDTGAFSPILDTFPGAFRFSPIDDVTYLGALPFTTDVAPLDTSSAQAAGSFSTGFLFAGQPFVPKTSGPIIADIAELSGAPNLTITSLPFDGEYGASTITTFILGPQASDPGECGDPANHIPLTVQWLERIGESDDYRYKIKWTHCITAAEDPTLAFVTFRANWRLEGVMTVAATVPSVTAVSPIDNAINIPTNSDISVTFNEIMNPATVIGGGFTVSPDVCTGVISTSDNKTFTCNPSADLAVGTVHTITLDTTITDAAGTPLANNVISTFTTGLISDILPPSIVSVVPADNVTDVAADATVAVTFTDDLATINDGLGFMGGSTIDAISVSDANGVNVEGVTTTSDNLTFIFTPSSTLSSNTEYTVTVSSDLAVDASGNQIAADNISAFTTAKISSLTDVDTNTTVSIDLASGASLVSLVIMTEGQVGGAPPDRVDFDDEFISYTINDVTSEVNVTIDFPQSLTGKTIYKVVSGVYTALIEGTDYQLIDDDTITLTIVDNGPFDSDPVTGTIIDPIVAGTDLGSRPVPGSLSATSWWLLLTAPLLLSIRRYTNKS